MDDVRLSSSSGSIHSAFSASLAAEEQRRRLEDAKDLKKTLTDHHDFPLDDNDDKVHRTENGDDHVVVLENGDRGDKRRLSQQSNSTSRSQAASPSAGNGSREVDMSGSHPSNHALSESVY